jgi:hypothetical protein
MKTRKITIKFMDNSQATIRGVVDFQVDKNTNEIKVVSKKYVKGKIETFVTSYINSFDVRAVKEVLSEDGNIVSTTIHHIHNTTVVKVDITSTHATGKTKKA